MVGPSDPEMGGLTKPGLVGGGVDEEGERAEVICELHADSMYLDTFFSPASFSRFFSAFCPRGKIARLADFYAHSYNIVDFNSYNYTFVTSNVTFFISKLHSRL